MSTLSDALIKSEELPVKLNAVPIIEIRVKQATAWTHTLRSYFLKNDSNSKTLVEVLTPRLDLASLVHKIQSNLNTHTASMSSSTSSSSSVSSVSEKNSSKRLRTKSPNNGSLTISQLATVGNDTENSNGSIKITPNNSIVNINSADELYSENKFVSILSEKYKALQLKELELMKQLRKSNQDKINMQLNFILKSLESNDEKNPPQQQQQLQSSQNGPINGEASNGALKLPTQKYPINIKCCSCFKSIASSINSNNAQQCKLCLGLFHSMNFSSFFLII